MGKHDNPLLRPPKNKSKKIKGMSTAKELKSKQKELDLTDEDEINTIDYLNHDTFPDIDNPD